jgi:ribosome biogenesis GTPase A
MDMTASWWLGQQLSNDQSLSGLLRAKSELFEQMWIKTTQILQESTFGWLPKQAADTGRFEVLQDQLEQGLRDALFRQMAPHRMVFISTESSGKSTFINALIGKELLPTGRKPHIFFSSPFLYLRRRDNHCTALPHYSRSRI